MIREQIDHRPLILRAQTDAALAQIIRVRKIAREIERIHDRDHRIEPRQLAETCPVLLLKGEGFRDRQRLADARALDEEVIEASRFRELAHLLQQVLA